MLEATCWPLMLNVRYSSPPDRVVIRTFHVKLATVVLPSDAKSVELAKAGRGAGLVALGGLRSVLPILKTIWRNWTEPIWFVMSRVQFTG